MLKIDYIPNDICYPITDMKVYSNFSSSNLMKLWEALVKNLTPKNSDVMPDTERQILPLTIDNRWQPVSKGW